MLADDGRRVLAAVQLLLELRLDQAALFFDHDDLVEPRSKGHRPVRLQRPRHADLVQPHAHCCDGRFGQIQVIKRLQHVEIAFAVRDDAQRGGRRVDHHAVEPVQARKGPHGVELEAVQPVFLSVGGVGLANAQAVSGQRQVVGQRDLHAVRVDIDRRRGLDCVLHALDTDPAAAVARHRPAEHAEVENFLHASRAQYRDHRVDHREFALVAGGRRFAGVVVAHQHQHAAVC